MENIVKNETRRDFLKVSGTVAGGLALGFYLPSGPRVAQADGGGGYASPNAWVRIGLDNGAERIATCGAKMTCRSRARTQPARRSPSGR